MLHTLLTSPPPTQSSGSCESLGLLRLYVSYPFVNLNASLNCYFAQRIVPNSENIQSKYFFTYSLTQLFHLNMYYMLDTRSSVVKCA